MLLLATLISYLLNRLQQVLISSRYHGNTNTHRLGGSLHPQTHSVLADSSHNCQSPWKTVPLPFWPDVFLKECKMLTPSAINENRVSTTIRQSPVNDNTINKLRK